MSAAGRFASSLLESEEEEVVEEEGAAKAEGEGGAKLSFSERMRGLKEAAIAEGRKMVADPGKKSDELLMDISGATKTQKFVSRGHYSCLPKLA